MLQEVYPGFQHGKYLHNPTHSYIYYPELYKLCCATAMKLQASTFCMLLIMAQKDLEDVGSLGGRLLYLADLVASPSAPTFHFDFGFPVPVPSSYMQSFPFWPCLLLGRGMSGAIICSFHLGRQLGWSFQNYWNICKQEPRRVDTPICSRCTPCL